MCPTGVDHLQKVALPNGRCGGGGGWLAFLITITTPKNLNGLSVLPSPGDLRRRPSVGAAAQTDRGALADVHVGAGQLLLEAGRN